jgi:hypothetical protein
MTLLFTPNIIYDLLKSKMTLIFKKLKIYFKIALQSDSKMSSMLPTPKTPEYLF